MIERIDNKMLLRQKAEDLLKNKLPTTVSSLPEAETLKIIHELEVIKVEREIQNEALALHQVELEMQNKELSFSKEQAETTAKKYTALYDLAPTGYFTLSDKGSILELNFSGATLLGKDRLQLKNSRFGFFVSDDTRPFFNLFLEKVFNDKTKEACEVTLITKGNLPIYVHLTGIVIENGKKCIVSVVDLTGSMLMDALQAKEKVLVLSEKRLQKKVELRTQELENLNKNIKIELGKRKISQKKLKQSVHDYKQLYAYLQNAREEERKLIARAVHDDLAQLLSTLKIELTSFKGNTDKMDFMVHDAVDSLLLLVEQSMDAVTTVITELRPIILDRMGLIPALKRLLLSFQKDTGINCDILIREDSSNLKGKMATAIYRIVQEGMNNIRMHSKASYVTLVITNSSSAFSLNLKDNGIGISQEKVGSHESFGIIGMKERIAGINGRIKMNGVPGKGTTIDIKVPLRTN